MEAEKRRKAHPLSVLTGQQQEEHSSTHKQATMTPRKRGFFVRRQGAQKGRPPVSRRPESSRQLMGSEGAAQALRA